MKGLESPQQNQSKIESPEMDRVRIAEKMLQMYYLTKIHPEAGTFFEEIQKSGGSFRQWFDEKEAPSKEEKSGSEKMIEYAEKHSEEAIQNFEDMDDLVKSYEAYFQAKTLH